MKNVYQTTVTQRQRLAAIGVYAVSDTYTQDGSCDLSHQYLTGTFQGTTVLVEMHGSCTSRDTYVWLHYPEEGSVISVAIISTAGKVRMFRLVDGTVKFGSIAALPSEYNHD